MTDAEKKLWWHLRQMAMKDSHFRRQATIGPYFVDFACHFWNNEVLGNIDGVMQIICAALRAPPPLTPPHRAMRGGRGTERS